ncbi:MAG TPA: hypothetical protein VJ873_01505 [bacterium]|nr:hypothetical protein [bacterium]
MGKDKWVMIGILLVLGFIGYRQFFSQSSEEPVYEKWSQAVAMRDCGTLEAMADGKAKDWAEDFCSQPAPAPDTSQAAADQTADINLPASTKEKALNVLRDLKSQTQNPDGTLTLVAKETPLPIPGTLKRPNPPRMVTLKLQKEGDAWKVVDYQSSNI